MGKLSSVWCLKIIDGFMSFLGPATVRMVNQAGASAALPLHVPPGHMVQQILDEQVGL